MIIKKGTEIATRQEDGGYVWDKVGTFSMANRLQIGCHGPTLEQLTNGGYLVKEEEGFDPLKYKVVYPEVWLDNGVYIYRKTISLTDKEIADNVQRAFLVKVSTIENGLDMFIDEVAKVKQYGTINMSATAACLAYTGYDNPYRTEAEAFGSWKASIWPLVFQIQSDYLEGKRPEPTLETIISELPPMVWPE